MHHCNGCGSAITASFARVFGDREGVVHGCPHCADRDGPVRNSGEFDAEAIGGG